MTPAPLTSRERVRLALAHQPTDRVPVAMICAGINAPARRACDALLRRERGIGLDAYLEPTIDVVNVGPAYVGPGLPTGADIWGVVRAPVDYGAGVYDEIVVHPLAAVTDAAQVARHRFPSTAMFDYAGLPERIRALQRARERSVMVANGNVFENSWYLRGFEQFFVDLIDNPDMAHAIMRRVTDFLTAHFRRMLAAADGMIDLVFTADDIAGQNGLLMSLSMWERFIKPYHIEINRVIHEFGAKVVYHSDGGVMDAVPGLIDMGIDVLQALQFDAVGMDPSKLKSAYGDRLCFAGGVSVQRTLPFGTPDDVRAEVQHLITVLGRAGGYILGPSHCIQAGTPPENILALFDTALTTQP
jgi:uroporphyrinogen decarboxylase